MYLKLRVFGANEDTGTCLKLLKEHQNALVVKHSFIIDKFKMRFTGL